MKPAPFRYLRPETLDEALAGLSEHADEAKVLAGGQSLVAMMNLRLARPTVLVDINFLPAMSYILASPTTMRIGALSRHRQLEYYPSTPGFDIIGEAARHVGHYAIRGRGTFGGSIAHADPAAEWPVLSSLFQADIVATSARGRRSIPVDDFFAGMFSTTLADDEMVTEVVLQRGFQHTGMDEFARRHGDFAVVTAAVGFDVRDGRIRGSRVVLGGVADQPWVSAEAAAVLDGNPASPEVFDEAARAAAAAVAPPSDIHADAAYRRHLSAVLIRSALDSALTKAGAPHA